MIILYICINKSTCACFSLSCIFLWIFPRQIYIICFDTFSALMKLFYFFKEASEFSYIGDDSLFGLFRYLAECYFQGGVVSFFDHLLSSLVSSPN